MEHLSESTDGRQETLEPLEDEELVRCPRCGHELDLPPPEAGTTGESRRVVLGLGAVGMGVEMAAGRIRAAGEAAARRFSSAVSSKEDDDVEYRRTSSPPERDKPVPVRPGSTTIIIRADLYPEHPGRI